tara:strand:+ start:320 stop:481 length:162 start_codon:yes stop_codon:yes gene_type:complete
LFVHQDIDRCPVDIPDEKMDEVLIKGINKVRRSLGWEELDGSHSVKKNKDNSS